MTKNANDVVIVSFARTAIDKFGGPLKNTHVAYLMAAVMSELIKRSGLKKEQIDEINVSTCFLMETAWLNDIPGRQALIWEGFPPTTISNHIDRACCSATSALQLSWKSLMLGEADISMVIGGDNMGHCPLYLDPIIRTKGFKIADQVIIDPLKQLGYPGFGAVAKDAGEIALQNGITREMQDEWSVGSHEKWGKAFDRGYFNEEIFTYEVKQGKQTIAFDKDQQPRPGTTLESLAKLATVNGSPTVTAGNAPGLNAGATGVIVMKRSMADKLGLKPLGKIFRVINVAEHYTNIATVPALAISKALEYHNIKLSDIELIEINEAFAAVPITSTKVLSNGDSGLNKHLNSITNVNGGAVAIGHPVGATGLRLCFTALRELKNRGGKYGVAAICGGLAQSDAVILEVE